MRDPTKKLMKISQFLKLNKTWIKPRSNSNCPRTLFIELKNNTDMLASKQKKLNPKTFWRRLNTMSSRIQSWSRRPRLN